MTLGRAGAVVRPLHETEAAWKRSGRVPPRVGEIAVEPCACGDVIRASSKPHLIEAAVLTHNNTTRHARWAIAVGWRQG